MIDFITSALSKLWNKIIKPLFGPKPRPPR